MTGDKALEHDGRHTAVFGTEAKCGVHHWGCVGTSWCSRLGGAFLC